MEELFLQVFDISNEIEAPLETVIVVFVLKYIQTPTIHITLVKVSHNETAFRIPLDCLSDFNISVVEDNVPSQIKGCFLPAIQTCSQLMCVAGLCAVLRRILKQIKEKSLSKLCRGLLGFRGGCLMACSEVSVWTKFCEVDLPKTTKELCSQFKTKASSDSITLPEDLMRLENHLQQPVRMHNIGKKRHELAQAVKFIKARTSETLSYDSVDVKTLNESSSSVIDVSHMSRNDSQKTNRLEDLDEENLLSPSQSADNSVISDSDSQSLPRWLRGYPQIVRFHNQNSSSSLLSVESINETNQQDNLKFSKKKSADDHLPHLCHLYAEGIEMTLADVILFPCIHYILVAYQPHITVLRHHIPLITQWYGRMVEDHLICAAAINLGLHMGLGSESSVQDVFCKMEKSSVANLCSKFGNLNFLEGVKTIHINSQISKALPNSEKDVLDSRNNEQTKPQSSSLLLTENIISENDDPLHIKVPKVPTQSLYISDPKRYRPQSRVFTRQSDVKTVLDQIEAAKIEVKYSKHPCETVVLDWEKLPQVVHPVFGDLPSSRVERKCQQVENIVSVVKQIAKDGDVIVDFCSGGGHVGVLLGYLLPTCQVVLVDNKEESLLRALHRIDCLNLTNTILYQCNLDYFCGDFTIGTSLHACGVATDLVLQRCLEKEAAFVTCPCCYGAVQNTHLITYPRSQIFRNIGLSYKEYLVLGHSADQTHANDPKTKQGTTCMGFIDTDRLMQARERNYQIFLCTLKPPSCTPKHNLLIGIPDGRSFL